MVDLKTKCYTLMWYPLKGFDTCFEKMINNKKLSHKTHILTVRQQGYLIKGFDWKQLTPLRRRWAAKMAPYLLSFMVLDMVWRNPTGHSKWKYAVYSLTITILIKNKKNETYFLKSIVTLRKKWTYFRKNNKKKQICELN